MLKISRHNNLYSLLSLETVRLTIAVHISVSHMFAHKSRWNRPKNRNEALYPKIIPNTTAIATSIKYITLLERFFMCNIILVVI